MASVETSPESVTQRQEKDSQDQESSQPAVSSDTALKQTAACASISQLFDLIKDLNSDDLQQLSCDAVQRSCKFLDESAGEPEIVSGAERLFTHLAGSLQPKECLILLIEQAREHWTDARFEALLLPVQKIFLRLNPPIGQSLAFTLEAFTEFLLGLPLPTIPMDMERKDRLLLDADPRVRRVYNRVPQFLSFVRPFVQQAAWWPDGRTIDNSDVCKQADDLQKCLLTILGQPLGLLDLSVTAGRAKSTSRACAERCVWLISRLRPDFVRTTVNERMQAVCLSDKTSDKTTLGLGTFAFLAFGENLFPNRIPHVYSRRYLLELNAPLSADLLEHVDLLPRLHGVQLVISLLENIEQDSLPVELVESEDMRRLVLAVVKATITAKTKELSSSLLKVLTLVCGTLEPAGKLQYLYAMLRTAPRAGGVVSCVIGMLSNEILASIDRGGRTVFAGPELERALQLVFALPNGEKTDLLENSERIMAALKFLRVVLPRDKKQDNVTGIWNVIPTVESKYFRLLFAGLELSRSHYELEIRKLKELRRGDPTGREFVSHGTPVELSKHQQVGVLETAVHTFNMMESVAKQITELIHSMQSGRDPH